MDIPRYLLDMPKRAAAESALFVRLPTAAVDKLDRAAEALGVRKKDLIAGLLSRYVHPETREGLKELSATASQRNNFDGQGTGAKVGTYSFRPFDAPEVMTSEQAAALFQIDESVVIELAEAGKLPGRKMGNTWRFARSALIDWLSASKKT